MLTLGLGADINYGNLSRVLAGASLDLNFSANSYYPGGGLSAAISTSRAQTVPSYAQTSSGLLVSFAADTPRITDQGLLVEEARTNLALQSNGFTNWAGASGGVGSIGVGTANFSSAPDGTASATRVVLALNGGTAGTDFSGWNNTNAVVANGSTYSGGVWIKSNTASSYAMQLMQVNGVAKAITVTPSWTFFSGVTAAISTSGVLRIRLIGGATPTNSDSADVSIWGGQIELGSFATSPIPTTTVAVTRAADVISLAGAAASAVPSSTGGAIYAKAVNLAAAGVNQALVNLTPTAGGQLMSYRSFSAGNYFGANYNGATVTSNAIGASPSTTLQQLVSWTATQLTVTTNGVAASAARVSGAPASSTGAILGSTGSGASFLNGYISRVAFALSPQTWATA